MNELKKNNRKPTKSKVVSLIKLTSQVGKYTHTHHTQKIRKNLGYEKPPASLW